MELLVVRHGPTVANRNGSFMGSLDLHLDLAPQDMEQIEKLRAEITARGPFLAYASPLHRARETGERILPDARLRFDDRLREWGLGVWEGRQQADIQRRFSAWFDESGRWNPRNTPPFGETFDAVESRVRSFLQDVSAESPAHSRASTVVVTHNGIIRMLRYISGQIQFGEFFANSEPLLQMMPIELSV